MPWVLKQAVALSPDVGYEKYLYLGQLLEAPEDALAATRKGVQVLQAQHAAAQAASSEEAPALSRALSGAMCSLSEMLIAGAQERAVSAAAERGCDAAAIEAASKEAVASVAEEAEHLLSLASTADPDSPEPGQALAALRYQQGRAADALEVLEGLIEEDDRVPDAWHLLALAYYSGHQYVEAAEVLAKGQALLAKLGAGPEDEITQEFAELDSVIKEAMTVTTAGAAQ
eukprot:XP_001699998.1 hypothetical protein CHLREDRAFT_166839 [Chlamydomonas reinhardtii]